MKNSEKGWATIGLRKDTKEHVRKHQSYTKETFDAILRRVFNFPDKKEDAIIINEKEVRTNGHTNYKH